MTMADNPTHRDVSHALPIDRRILPMPINLHWSEADRAAAAERDARKIEKMEQLKKMLAARYADHDAAADARNKAQADIESAAKDIRVLEWTIAQLQGEP
jgi:hypothetical protein